MAYKTAELEQKAIKAIEKEKLIFFDEIASYLPCSRATFYNHKLDKLDSIKDVLENNKAVIKSGLRNKWYESDNATVQIALMRLVCSDSERRKLAVNYNELSGPEGEKMQIEIVTRVIESK